MPAKKSQNDPGRAQTSRAIKSGAFKDTAVGHLRRRVTETAPGKVQKFILRASGAGISRQYLTALRRHLLWLNTPLNTGRVGGLGWRDLGITVDVASDQCRRDCISIRR